MKLSKKSWHYRLYMKISEDEPTSFCVYFWQLVLLTFLTAFITAFIGWLLYGMIAMWWYIGTPTKHLSDSKQEIISVGHLGYAIVGLLLVMLYATRKDNLLLKYLKAFFNKYCPKIDWE